MHRRSRSGPVAKERRFAVIMAGGVGSRFWPWSRRKRPKQLLALAGRRSMLAETVARLRGMVAPRNILIVTNRSLVGEIARELPALPRASILGEPTGRNTAPCIGWATLEILHRRDDAVIAVLPADHVIGPRERFQSDLLTGFDVADRAGQLVTFGIRPTEPATGYGYIRAGALLGGHGEARRVGGFVEKPTLAVAKRYVDSGSYFWNSGMFVWRADVLWKEFGEHLPALARALKSMAGSRTPGSRGRVPRERLDRAYPRLESISIDYGVLERSRNVAMLPANFSWSDIGSWDATAALWPVDADGNASRDPLLAVDSRGNVVATHGKPVALLGVSDLVVVDAGDALLVCPRARCQDVRRIVSRLGEPGWRQLS
ncbi:MAG: mannose-1-phosphate guanylyltransferase [Deltaproteobacteria bacterium]|nr:mannose-1-phosphate guanylyltransferase [Deltaproteobacteria bacterium]